MNFFIYVSSLHHQEAPMDKKHQKRERTKKRKFKREKNFRRRYIVRGSYPFPLMSKGEKE
jgi:hypothetical protein